eukprot:scpid39460/ scgid25130/ 
MACLPCGEIGSPHPKVSVFTLPFVTACNVIHAHVTSHHWSQENSNSFALWQDATTQQQQRLLPSFTCVKGDQRQSYSPRLKIARPMSANLALQLWGLKIIFLLFLLHADRL